MRTLLTLSLFVFLTACATNQSPKQVDAGNGWSCSANSILGATYDGGNSANIHLAPYAYGGNYSVTKSADGKTATGTTANGTKFTCVQP